MRSVIAWWRDEIERHPVLIGWAVIFVVHAGMNAKLGHEIGGGQGIPAAFYAACFLGFACVGAWAADKLIVDRVRAGRGLLVTLALLQLVIGQMAGWQSFGLTLAKGAGELEAKATSRRTTQEALDDARKERAKIGTQRAIGSIRADENLECAIKGRQYKDGVGPKCTALRGELAAAERAEKLQADINRLTAELRAGPSIKDGNALYEVPQGIANALGSMIMGHETKIGPDDVRFVWLIILVFALEFFGTFGLALVRMMGGDGTPHRPTGRGGRPPETPRDGGTIGDVVNAIAGALPQPSPMLALAGPDVPHRDLYLGGHPIAPQSAMHGAPINITIQSGADRASLAGASAAHPAAAPSVERVTPAAEAASKRDRRDIVSLPADAPPVDRSRIARDLSPEERQAADVVLAFRAACLVDTPGGIVDAANVYRRYQHWAGERALTLEAFFPLLADVTGIAPAMIGGHPHIRDVALRAGAKLEAVA